MMNTMNDNNELESPFTWDIPEQNQHQSDWMVTKPAERLSCMVDDPGFKWCRYGKLLVLMYEHTVRQEKDKAMEYTNQCEAVLSDPVNQSDLFYQSIEKALWHVFLATKLKISEGNSNKKHVQSIISQITPFSQMNSVEKAGMLGIKTMTVMAYGPQIGGTMLDTIREAVRLCPTEPEWHHVEGRILKRLRGTMDVFNTNREPIIKAFQTAYNINPKNASYVITYAEELQKDGHNKSLAYNEYHEYWRKVMDLYDAALRLRPECPYHLVLVAAGYTEAPKEYKDAKESKDLLLKAEKKADKYYLLLHALGKAYENVDGTIENMTKASEYFEKASKEGSYGANFSYIKLQMKLTKKQFNPIPILERVRDEFYDVDRKAECIIQMGCYHLFINKDLDSAIGYFAEVLDKYPHVKFIKEFKPIYIEMKIQPISLLHLIHSSIFVRQTENPFLLSPEQKSKRNQLLTKVYHLEPQLKNQPGSSRYQQWIEKFCKNPKTKSVKCKANPNKGNSGEAKTMESNTMKGTESKENPTKGGSLRYRGKNDRAEHFEWLSKTHKYKSNPIYCKNKRYTGWNNDQYLQDQGYVMNAEENSQQCDNQDNATSQNWRDRSNGKQQNSKPHSFIKQHAKYLPTRNGADNRYAKKLEKESKWKKQHEERQPESEEIIDTFNIALNINPVRNQDEKQIYLRTKSSNTQGSNAANWRKREVNQTNQDEQRKQNIVVTNALYVVDTIDRGENSEKEKKTKGPKRERKRKMVVEDTGEQDEELVDFIE
uniref:Uncharacterized protein n=1 Tax=Cacopsylla melanoneura TaxID=428564 RepID=A0A8D8YQJ2_9HEMI